MNNLIGRSLAERYEPEHDFHSRPTFIAARMCPTKHLPHSHNDLSKFSVIYRMAEMVQPLFLKGSIVQSNKDSNGGKSHPSKTGSSARAEGGGQEKKKTANSPIGSQKKGEKKTTPH
jgi:hypothetical protein